MRVSERACEYEKCVGYVNGGTCVREYVSVSKRTLECV